MLLKSKFEETDKLIKSGNILTSMEECYCYASDALNFPEDITIPDRVMFPESTEDVRRIMEYADRNDIPIIPRGAGTNMVGACVCTEGGIVLNFSKMNRIIDLDKINMTARVQPGVVMGDLKKAVERDGLFFPPDPSNYGVSTVGGAIAQSSGGALAFKYGTMKDYVLSLEVVTAGGEVMRLGAETAKDSVGYHLAQLMVGSEGTLGIVTEAVLRLIPKPETANVVVAYFNDADSAVNAVNKVILSNIHPAAIEFMDNNTVKTIEAYIPSRFKTVYDCVVMIEVDGDAGSVAHNIERIIEIMRASESAKIYVPPTMDDYERVWRARRSSFAAASRLAPDVISDDVIVPRKNMAEMIRYCRSVSERYNINMCLVGHIGDGNLHPQMVFNAEKEDEFRNYLKAKSEIYAQAVKLGGTISAEHGVGLEKKGYLPNVVDKKAVEYMKMIKRVFDPKNILNRGKVLYD